MTEFKMYSVILVGLPLGEVYPNHTDDTDIDDRFVLAGVCNDPENEATDLFVGISLVECEYGKIQGLANTIVTEKNRALFKEITGKDANVYLTTYFK